MPNQRTQLLLDIEHDLSRIKDRLGLLEDHFEDDGLIAQLAEVVHVLATKVEALEDQAHAHEQ